MYVMPIAVVTRSNAPVFGRWFWDGGFESRRTHDCALCV